MYGHQGGKAGGGGGGGMNLEIGIDIYTLICIKSISNKNLLYTKKTYNLSPSIILDKTFIECQFCDKNFT